MEARREAVAKEISFMSDEALVDMRKSLGLPGNHDSDRQALLYQIADCFNAHYQPKPEPVRKPPRYSDAEIELQLKKLLQRIKPEKLSKKQRKFTSDAELRELLRDEPKSKPKSQRWHKPESQPTVETRLVASIDQSRELKARVKANALELQETLKRVERVRQLKIATEQRIAAAALRVIQKEREDRRRDLPWAGSNWKTWREYQEFLTETLRARMKRKTLESRDFEIGRVRHPQTYPCDTCGRGVMPGFKCRCGS